MHQCIFLLNAGHETTTNLIGNALYALTEWTREKSALIEAIADADRMRLAVEEFLRFESANQLGNRISTREVDVGGVKLPPGRKSRCASARRTEIRSNLPNRIGLILPAIRIVTLRSASGSTPAPE